MISEKSLDRIRSDMQKRLGEKRFCHTLGVEKEMRNLARIYMPAEETVAAAAGLLHDITKELSLKEQLALAEKYGIDIPEEEKASAALLHAKTGAFYAKEAYPSVVNKSVFSAILKHTTANGEMTLLDKLLYLADFIEEGRSYPSCIRVRQAFYEGINSATDKLAFLNAIMIEAYDASLEALRRENLYISPSTLMAKEVAEKERIASQGKK